jgi:hypothetical protein
MKKIILSVAVATMALSTAAAALDNLKADGQATLYYETHNGNGTGDKGFANTDSSTAAAALQFNLSSDLGNNFAFGSQMTVINSLGLEKQTVNGLKQSAGTNGASTTDDIALTQVYVSKKVNNTTLKFGRQELPQSLSPLAYSEGWNVYKNTFDAMLAINTDLPQTTLVGAYVSKGTGMTLGSMGNPVAVTTAGTATITGEAYMITAATKLVPMTDLTLTYYDLKDVGANLLGAGNAIGADAMWANAKINDLPVGIELQAGKISPDSAAFDDTTAFGAKVTGKVGAVGLKAIYTSVDAPATGKVGVAFQNTGTGIKSPLYSQMMYNQNMIALDSDTIVLGASYNMGDMGTIAANYGMTTMGNRNGAANTAITGDTDYNELDLVYKVKSGGVQYFAIAAIRDIDNGGTMNTTTGLNNATMTKDTVLRFWARYNF